jgi:hypothetical protein
MLESIAAKIISSYLGEYVEGTTEIHKDEGSAGMRLFFFPKLLPR